MIFPLDKNGPIATTLWPQTTPPCVCYLTWLDHCSGALLHNHSGADYRHPLFMKAQI